EGARKDEAEVVLVEVVGEQADQIHDQQLMGKSRSGTHEELAADDFEAEAGVVELADFVRGVVRYGGGHDHMISSARGGSQVGTGQDGVEWRHRRDHFIAAGRSKNS